MCMWYWSGVNCPQHNPNDLSDCVPDSITIPQLLKHNRMHLIKQQARGLIRSGFECDWMKRFLAMNNFKQGCRHFGEYPFSCDVLKIQSMHFDKNAVELKEYTLVNDRTVWFLPPVMGKSYTDYDLKVIRLWTSGARGFSRRCCTAKNVNFAWQNIIGFKRHTSGIYWRRHWNWSKTLNDASSPSCISDLLRGHQQLVSRLSSQLLCILLSPFECKVWTHL